MSEDLTKDIETWRRWSNGSAVDEDYPTTSEAAEALDRVLETVTVMSNLIDDIWLVIEEHLPEAIGHNTLPAIVDGIARQRDWQHTLKDHLVDTAARLTVERDRLKVERDKSWSNEREIRNRIIGLLGGQQPPPRERDSEFERITVEMRRVGYYGLSELDRAWVDKWRKEHNGTLKEDS